jgi:phage/plasmid-associated DNA primase
MQSIAPLQFDIRKFVEVLVQTKKNYWICPACDKPKLTIDKMKGKYQCWNCYNTEEIARILTEPEREEKRRQQESQRIVTTKTPQERIDEWVKESGVSDSITAANLRHIEDSLLVAQMLNWNWYSGSPGWYVFGCDPITGMRTKRGQFKPDTPLKRPDEQSSQKYITFPKGGKDNSRLAAVYIVLTLGDWQRISEKWGIPIEESDIDNSRDDLGFWKWVLNHPEIPIVVSEGIKKEGCLLSLGWVSISLTGVWNGQTGKGKKLHKDLAPFIVPGRRVYLAFDADVLIKEGVEGALRQLGHLIKREKAEVFVCRWSLDDGKGIDDFIVGGGDFQAVIEEATSYSEWLKCLQGDGSGNGSGSGSGGGDGNGGDAYQPDPNDKHPEAFYRPFCEALKLPFENCVTAGTFDNWAYRAEFGAAEGDWRVIDSAFYQWLDHLGYWEHQTDNRINTMIADCGDKAFKLKNSKEFGWQVGYPYGTNSHKESAFKYCRSRLERPEPLPVNTHLRAFKNCVVDLRTGARMPHDKGYYLTSIIPYDYEPGKECPEAFRQFVADSFGEDMLPIIRAFTSMFLDPTAPYGRFPHLIGQSGGGKGTMGRFWNSLFGEDGASSGDFSNLSTAEGRHQYLTGKQIFSIPDAGGYVSGLRAFYELVDNGGMSGRALFNPVGYFKTWNIRFWIASVDHLQIENAGDGWARRAYPIPVRARTIKPDPDLRLKLEACKADVISWALAMPRDERDRILLSPPTNERVINLTMDSALYGDSTKSFVDLCLRPSSNAGFMPNHLLHSWYVAYCKEHGYTPLGMSKFISHLKTILPRNFSDRTWTPMVNGKRTKIPAHWEHLGAIEGAFIRVEPDSDFAGNPSWICIKAACEEGGLMEFEDYWNPPPPELSDNNTLSQSASDALDALESGTEIETGTGWYKKSQIAETTQNQCGRGGTGCPEIASSTQNSSDLLVQNAENKNDLDFSLTSIQEGVPPVCKPDSSNLRQYEADLECCDNQPTVAKEDKPLTLPMLVKVLESVETLEELEAVEKQASEQGFNERIWKPAVWKHLSKNAQARIKGLSDARSQQPINGDLEFCLRSLADLEALGSGLADGNQLAAFYGELEAELESRTQNCLNELPSDFWERIASALQPKFRVMKLAGTLLDTSIEWISGCILDSIPSPPLQKQWIFITPDGERIALADAEQFEREGIADANG